MKRSHFIRNSAIAGLGLSFFPQMSFAASQEPFSRDQLIGKSNPDIIGESYTSKMHRETKQALSKMKEAALEDGIKIEVVSAFRSFQRQKEIYEAKYVTFLNDGSTPEEAIAQIIEYSTIPGTSRHHWGTDLDLIDANVPRPESVLQPGNFHGKGPYCKLKEWLDSNSENFGFYEVYTDEPQRKGFKYEPWHFSYAPVAIPMLRAYRKLDIKRLLRETKIKGYDHFSDAFIDRYTSENILDINPKLL